MKKILITLLALVLLTSSVAAKTQNVDYNSLPDVDFTKPSLANPHVVRMGDIHTRAGRAAVLERVYDLSGAEAMKKKHLEEAANLFKRKGDALSESDVIRLMTPERVLVGAKKFKQSVRIWDVKAPANTFTIALPVAYDSEKPEILNPEFLLRENDLLASQLSPDGKKTLFYSADLKKKILKRNNKLKEFPEMSFDDYTDFNDHVMFELFEKEDTHADEIYRVGRFTVTDTVTGDIVVADYNYDWNTLDENGDETSHIHPMIEKLGNAGFTLQGYTRGTFVVAMGDMNVPNNILETVMPDDWSSLESVRAAITKQWTTIAKEHGMGYPTFQVLGYKLK